MHVHERQSPGFAAAELSHLRSVGGGHDVATTLDPNETNA
jgi:hypothetical protein